ncbi:unnamed protein product [Ascophyllum nodosum]
MSMDMDMDMSMSFEFTCDVGPLLFDWWTIESCTSLYLSCVPVIMLGLARHWAFSCVSGSNKSSKGIPTSRTTTLLENSGLETSSTGVQPGRLGKWHRFSWTMISTTGAALSLLSMLVVMTYNSVLFMAVLVGGENDRPQLFVALMFDFSIFPRFMLALQDRTDG